MHLASAPTRQCAHAAALPKVDSMNEESIKGMVSVVVPAFNEPALPNVTQRICAELDRIGRPYEVLVIDDASTMDGASQVGCDGKAKVHRQPVNRGYGASLKEGIRLSKGEIVLTIDADGQHQPEDMVRFLAKMDEGADAVLGCRQKVLHSSLWRMPGKWLLLWLARYLSRQRIPDINCGYRAFRRKVIERYLDLCCDRFSFSTTSALAILLEHHRTVFLPVETRKREGRSTVAPRDGFAALLSVVQIIMLFAPLRVLMPPSLTLLGLGTAMLIHDLINVDVNQSTILLLIGGLLFLFFGLLADQVGAIRRKLL